ncbi:heptaprenyl diphosphate synthase component 1 [Pontibacillus litoralis]|uniref:Heptaprenyl diphosphate synthase subunit I n=1 Tax=Pontibacillus litoralis JSM 072002 TaxID=1385512 RepID=A0A0A5HWH1_9BACI|nr:heptaprenyl diphosphate synthase component 1 [Pontibacillus litoralis]KGX87967.1 heptaprenyl diphosphate synthase subunit I [Pontibacillus litoralis JSM 072002]
MILEDNDIQVKEIKASIEHQIRHPYLAKFIQNPVISEDKIMFLTTLVTQSDIPREKQKQYIITTMLVQIALDTHERVSISSASDSNEIEKKRQLTVLAGDYFSGLYYLVLSKLEDIPMIQTLASAIKEINELKMKIYNQDFATFAEVMEALKKVESLLIQRVASFIQRTNVNEVAGDWLLAMRLSQEQRKYQTREVAPFMELLNSSTFLKANGVQSLRMIESHIIKQLEKVSASIIELPYNFAPIQRYIQEQLHQTFHFKQQALEEG